MTVTEQDFDDLAFAAYAAQDRGDTDRAQRLDVLARKANADLTRASFPPDLKTFARSHSHPVRWQDMPSVFASHDKR